MPTYQWLLTCLGNPGKDYEATRHNIGFMAADELARREGVKLNKLRYRALTGEVRVGGQRVLVLKPQTYMNLSGESVKLAGGFYKIPPERVLVISDDVALPLCKLQYLCPDICAFQCLHLPCVNEFQQFFPNRPAQSVRDYRIRPSVHFL